MNTLRQKNLNKYEINSIFPNQLYLALLNLIEMRGFQI